MSARTAPAFQTYAAPFAGAVLLCYAAATAAGQGPAGGAFLTDDGTDAAPWSVTGPDGAEIRGVRVERADGGAAPGCVEATWTVAVQEAHLRLDRPVGPTAAIGELTAAVAACTPHRTAACLRVVFPNTVDPDTGGAATALITGRPEPPLREPAWRTLTVGTGPATLAEARRRVRLRLGADRSAAPPDLSAPYVDRAGVLLWVSGDGGEFPAGVRADDLRVGPLVATEGILAEEIARPEPRARVSGGRMTVDGDPFFPRVTQDMATDPRALAASGFNLVMVRDWRDRTLLGRLAEAGLGAAAQPPRAGEAGAGGDDLNAPAEAGLAPFGPATDPIWLWDFGPRVPGDPRTVAELTRWVSDVRSADAARDRPVLVGVTGSERAYSRVTDLLGVSRMVCGTALPLWEHTAILREVARRKARPGEPLFTWIQTVPHARTRKLRAAAGVAPAVIEPELIRRQALGAVAGGVKGVGYWLTEPLDDATPARQELRLALTLTNLELAAVEPLLATATRVEPLRVRPGTTGDPAAANAVRGTSTATVFNGAASPGSRGGSGFGGGGGGGGFGEGFGSFAAPARVTTAGPARPRPEGQCTAALLHRGADRLVVAVWHGEHDQFVPGPAPFTTAEVTIPAAIATASVWRVTPTGMTTLQPREVPGGMRVTIGGPTQDEEFGEAAVLLVTPDRRAALALRRRIAELAPAAAEAAVRLADLKLTRTRETDAALRGSVPDGRRLDAYLRAATSYLMKARQALAVREWDLARVNADRARRFARAVQRDHWDRLAGGPTGADMANGSPHLIAFSTLPDHLELSRSLAEARPGRVLPLLGGTAAADRGAPVRNAARRTVTGRPDAERYFVDYNAPPSVAPAAVVTARGELRLSARLKTGAARPDLLDRNQVVYGTPPSDIPAGRAAVIRGEVKVDGAVVGNGEGVSVHDDWAGEQAGLRWTGGERAFFSGSANGGWVPFELVRPAAPDDIPANADGSRPLRVLFILHGLGEARFRGLTVEAVDLTAADRTAEASDPPPAPAPRLIDRLPGFLRRN